MGTADRRITTRRAAAVLAGLFVVAGCGGSENATLATLDPVPETVELGAFPEALTGVDVPEVATPTTETVATSAPSTTVPRRDPISGPLGDEVFGNRVILIGDTVIASTAPRFDGSMCEALEAFGWQTEIEAEVGRFVDFGRTVYDARVSPDVGEEWDVVGIMFGNHFDGDVEAFGNDLTELVTAVSPTPTIVYTVYEDDTYQAALNEIIRQLPRFFPNVVIVDWAQIVAAEPDVLVADTPSDLSDEGRGRLALFTAAALGEAPPGETPGCVDSVFTDDSAIVL